MKGSPRSKRKPVVIAIDTGTKGGYSVFQGARLLESGGWNHTARTKRKKNPEMRGDRWLKFQRNLTMTIEKYLAKGLGQKDIVVAYEMVRRHLGTTAAHVYGGWLCVMEIIAVKYPGIRWVPVEISTWKIAMTGAGNADKPAYVAAANKRYGLNLTLKDEDECAAVGIGHCVIKNKL